MQISQLKIPTGNYLPDTFELHFTQKQLTTFLEQYAETQKPEGYTAFRGLFVGNGGGTYYSLTYTGENLPSRSYALTETHILAIISAALAKEGTRIVRNSSQSSEEHGWQLCLTVRETEKVGD